MSDTEEQSNSNKLSRKVSINAPTHSSVTDREEKTEKVIEGRLEPHELWSIQEPRPPPEPRGPARPVYVPCANDYDGNMIDFIYGGPFTPAKHVDGFLNCITPMNIPLSGIFKQSFAYRSLKDNLPVILTKVIDYASKESGRLGANGQQFIQHVGKLKNDLMTNKPFEKFTEESDEADKWNVWIHNLSVDNSKYFNNNWAWTESYVYRKLWEVTQLHEGLKGFDYFAPLKDQAISNNLEPMCVVAERVLSEMLAKKEDKKDRKDEFSALIKVGLWANRCDLSLSVGEETNMLDVCPQPILPFPKPGKPPKVKKGAPTGPPPLTNVGCFDPFQVSLDLKSNLLIDDSPKALDLLEKRATKIRTQIEKFNEAIEKEPGVMIDDIQLKGDGTKQKKAKKEKPPPPDPDAPVPEPPPRIVCPAKQKVPQEVFFDIVCDNQGYELFADLCVAHWVIAQEIVDKVRFHLKKCPWFVSDVTIQDFRKLVSTLKTASFAKTTDPPPPAKPTQEPIPVRDISAHALNQLATQWEAFIEDGTFQLYEEDYWTYPHTYPQMKKYDYYMYNRLQYAAMILFKGDLNYRKLLGERNCVPTDKFDPCLQGFQPAPILASRNIKSEIICGLAKGRIDQLKEFDPQWAEKGNFGMIQLGKKAEAIPKKPVRPCMDYGATCFGEICPVHTDI